MKKFLFLVAILNFSMAISQCTITGADQVQVGERQVYTVSNSLAECENCYNWNYIDQNIILESDLQKNELTLKGALPGDALLSLEIKTKTGKEKCDKLIKVIAPISNILTNDNVKCDINISSFKEVRAGDKMVSFEPETTETNFTYKWTAYYRGGDKKMLSGPKPQFDYSNEHVIDKVEMEVGVNNCTKKITKAYDTNFWYFF